MNSTPEQRQRAAQSYRAEIETYPEFKILNALVQQPDASPTNAVQQILSLASAVALSNESGSLGVHPWHTFVALIEIAKRTAPAQQTKLVECVSQLQKVKVVHPTTGGPLRDDDYLVWAELPALGYTAADEWHAFDVTDPNTAPEDKRRWENMIALLAQLSAAADVDYNNPTIGEMDFSFWSLAAFKNAFEPDPAQNGQQAPTDVAVRTACLWIVHASDRLWANVKHGRVFGKRGDDLGTKITYEMWEAWERGLRAVQVTCTNEDTERLVMEALAHMKRAEGEK